MTGIGAQVAATLSMGTIGHTLSHRLFRPQEMRFAAITGLAALILGGVSAFTDSHEGNLADFLLMGLGGFFGGFLSGQLIRFAGPQCGVILKAFLSHVGMSLGNTAVAFAGGWEAGRNSFHHSLLTFEGNFWGTLEMGAFHHVKPLVARSLPRLGVGVQWFVGTYLAILPVEALREMTAGTSSGPVLLTTLVRTYQLSAFDIGTGAFHLAVSRGGTRPAKREVAGARECEVRWSPSGLIVRPPPGVDLTRVAQTVLEGPHRIPNQRIVLDLLHWDSVAPADRVVRHELQRLADQFATVIYLRTRNPSSSDEIVPVLLRREQALRPAMVMMPGMGMSLGLHQRQQLRQTLRQELRLELRLELRMELHQVQTQEQAGFHDDLAVAETVPKELIEVHELLGKMATAPSERHYLERADRILDLAGAIRDPTHRMMAICRLAEELYHYPSLHPYVKALYAQHFTETFTRSGESEQPSLCLMVAASQVRTGQDLGMIKGLVIRAIALGEKHNVTFLGNDLRNLRAILERWPRTEAEGQEAMEWVTRFVERMEWVPSPEDIERGRVADPLVEPEEAPVAVAEPVPTPRSLTPEERTYVRSGLVQRAMEAAIRERGHSEETFRLLMELASHDSWEETAVVAYRLLAAHPPHQGRLMGALGHFENPYYRAKAVWVLAEAMDNGVLEKRAEVERALGPALLNETQRRHEEFSLGRAEADPLADLLPGGIPEGLVVRSVGAIEQWAEGLLPPPSTETARPAGERTAPDRPIDPEREREAEEASRKELERERRQDEKGALAIAIAKSLMAQRPGDVGLQIASIKLVAGSGSGRAWVVFLEELPEGLSPEVVRAAEEIVDSQLQASPYHQALAKVCLMQLPPPPTSPYRVLVRTFGPYLKAAATDESVPNSQVISDLTTLARRVGGAYPSLAKRLMTLARKRVKLFGEKVKELTPGEAAARDRETREPGELATWEKLHKQGQALVLASLAYERRYEKVVRNRIKGLKDPYLEVLALSRRADLLSCRPETEGVAARYMADAVRRLAAIPEVVLRVATALELEEQYRDHRALRGSLRGLADAVDDQLWEAELTRLTAERSRFPRPPESWIQIERVPQMVLSGQVSAEVMGRLLTSRQLGRLLQRGDLSPTHKARLLSGQLKNGPYQGAFEVTKALLEGEEARPSSEHLPLIDQLFSALLDGRDGKAVAYLQGRETQLLERVQGRVTPEPFTPVEQRWVRILLERHRGSALLPLIYAEGLALRDRLALLEELARRFVVDAEVVSIYRYLQENGKEALFFEIVSGLNRALPRIRITRPLIDQLLNDPGVQRGEKAVGQVIDSWVEVWNEFNNLESSEERVHLLATNLLLAEMYYREESAKYSFGSQELTFERFLGIVKAWDAVKYRQDFAAVRRYEEALEKAEPTTEAMREDGVRMIEGRDDLEPAEREFLLGVVRGTEALTEEAILRVREIGRRIEWAHPEAALPPNRRRVYRLYFGEAPIEGSGEFRRAFTPTAKKGAREPLSLTTEFRVNFRGLIDLLYLNWSTSEVERLFRERRAAISSLESHQERLRDLLAGNLGQEALAVEVGRLHAELVADLEGYALPAARGKIRTTRNDYFNREILPKVLGERSHIANADYVLMRSAQAREMAARRRFNDLTLDLDAFNGLVAEETARKREIAERLHLSTRWRENSGERVMVEMTLLADLAGLRDDLRERLLTPLVDTMRRQAEAREEQWRLGTRAPGSGSELEVLHVDKREIYLWIRIGDFRPCCIASDGFVFASTVRGYHADRMTQAFAIYDPRTRAAVGHMIGHLGLSGSEEAPTFFLNGLYLRTQYRGEAQDNGCLDILDEFGEQAGFQRVRHGINPYHDLTRKPPAGFSTATSRTVLLRSIRTETGGDVHLYNDLGSRVVNEPVETTHYQLAIR